MAAHRRPVNNPFADRGGTDVRRVGYGDHRNVNGNSPHGHAGHQHRRGRNWITVACTSLLIFVGLILFASFPSSQSSYNYDSNVLKGDGNNAVQRKTAAPVAKQPPPSQPSYEEDEQDIPEFDEHNLPPEPVRDGEDDEEDENGVRKSSISGREEEEEPEDSKEEKGDEELEEPSGKDSEVEVAEDEGDSEDVKTDEEEQSEGNVDTKDDTDENLHAPREDIEENEFGNANGLIKSDKDEREDENDETEDEKDESVDGHNEAAQDEDDLSGEVTMLGRGEAVFTGIGNITRNTTSSISSNTTSSISSNTTSSISSTSGPPILSPLDSSLLGNVSERAIVPSQNDSVRVEPASANVTLHLPMNASNTTTPPSEAFGTANVSVTSSVTPIEIEDYGRNTTLINMTSEGLRIASNSTSTNASLEQNIATKETHPSFQNGSAIEAATNETSLISQSGNFTKHFDDRFNSNETVQFANGRNETASSSSSKRSIPLANNTSSSKNPKKPRDYSKNATRFSDGKSDIPFDKKSNKTLATTSLQQGINATVLSEVVTVPKSLNRENGTTKSLNRKNRTTVAVVPASMSVDSHKNGTKVRSQTSTKTKKPASDSKLTRSTVSTNVTKGETSGTHISSQNSSKLKKRHSDSAVTKSPEFANKTTTRKADKHPSDGQMTKSRKSTKRNKDELSSLQTTSVKKKNHTKTEKYTNRTSTTAEREKREKKRAKAETSKTSSDDLKKGNLRGSTSSIV